MINLLHASAGVGHLLSSRCSSDRTGREVGIVCLPGEILVELGLAIKQASPFKTTLVIELSNAVETMYVPPRAAYAGGSYEVTNSAVEPGSGEMLVEAAIRLLREMARDVGGRDDDDTNRQTGFDCSLTVANGADNRGKQTA